MKQDKKVIGKIILSAHIFDCSKVKSDIYKFRVHDYSDLIKTFKLIKN